MPSMPIGQHVNIQEVSGARTYHVDTGDRYLTALEDGEIRCWPERHTFILNEETGDIVVMGDYGVFAYCWTDQMRAGRSLHNFLAGMSFDYFMRKASTTPHMVADIDATITRMKRELLKDRRDGDLDKALAKNIWDSIELYLDPGQGRDEFMHELFSDATLADYYCDGGPYIIEREHDGMRRFWDQVWSTFRQDVLLAEPEKQAA